MSTQANHFRIGMFVIVAVALLFIGIVTFGGLEIIPQPTITIETYVNESIKGLQVGSKVRLMGVPIGTVEEMEFAGEIYELSEDMDLAYGEWIVLRMKIDVSEYSRSNPDSQLDRLNRRVERGLRFRVTSAGITGGQFIQAEYVDPEKHPPFAPPWAPEYPYVPSAGGVFAEITESIQTLTGKLEELDIQRIQDGLTNLMEHADQAILDAEMKVLSGEIQAILGNVKSISGGPEMKKSLANVEQITKDGAGMVAGLREDMESARVERIMANLDESADNINQTMKRLPGAMDQLNSSLAKLDRFMTGETTDLEATLMELRLVMVNLREITDIAKRYPASLLLGKEPTMQTPSGEKKK